MIAMRRNRFPRSLALWLLALCAVGAASWALILWVFMLVGSALKVWL